MRRLAPLLLLVACTTAPAPQPVPPTPAAPAPAAAPGAPTPQQHGLTIEEEALALRLEDRREFDPAVAGQWIGHTNALHRTRMAMALGRIGPHVDRQPVVALLSRLATDPNPRVRETAAFSLGEIGHLSGADALVQFASDRENAGVAAEAVEALSKLAPALPLARYTPFTDASLPDGVRGRALRFLFRFNSDEASAIAMNALESTSSLIRQEATYALGRRAYAPARERLVLLLTDPNVLTRAYAANALGRIGAPESVGPLFDALRDAHPWIRTNALVALGRIAAKDPNALMRGDVMKDVLRIEALTDDPDPGTRASSIDVLGYYATRNDVARKRLFEIAQNGSRWDRELAAGTIVKQFGDTNAAAVTDLLATASNWAKVRMAEASAGLKTGGASLRKRLAADTDPMVRANALLNIPEAGVDAEMEIIMPAIAADDVVLRAVAIDRYSKSASKNLEVLRAAEQRARNDRDGDARAAAVTAISEIDHPEREAFLRGLLADANPVIRRIAADAVAEKLGQPRPAFTPLPVERTDYAQIVQWSREPHTATIHLTRGKVEVSLLTADAPMTTWNFAQLARAKYFDNTTFMRVVPNFVIQGGDPRNDMNGGPGYAIRDEINLQKYTRGAVGMALSGPDTGGSQFFITHSPQPHLDGGYTIFGRVYEGMNGVVDQTERGDRVETITIDTHAPVAAAELDGVQRTPLPLEIGPMTADRLMTIVPDYAQRKADYKPDISVVEMLKSYVQAGDRVEVYLGTWCPDSQREVPRFLKIVDDLKQQYGTELPVSFVALDRSKSKPANLIEGKSIEKVATFIYYRGDRELGRVVEKPNSLMEDDLLAIAAAK